MNLENFSQRERQKDFQFLSLQNKMLHSYSADNGNIISYTCTFSIKHLKSAEKNEKQTRKQAKFPN